MEKQNQDPFRQNREDGPFSGNAQKGKPENQNQTHNSRREGMGPNTKRKPG